MRRRALLAASASMAGCAVPGTIPQDSRLPAAPATPLPAPAPRVRLPQDEGPHDFLTEWWYYTGHLDPADGLPGEWGFQLTFFQVQRRGIPTVWLAHAAVADLRQQRFSYAERTAIAPGSYEAPRLPAGFRLRVAEWTMEGRDGSERLAAGAPGAAFDVRLDSRKPPALHNGEGFITYGPAGFSYYYSRTRMAVAGRLRDDSGDRAVSGEAWMDRQWGNFLTLEEGGWEWLALHLADGTDYMFYLIRDARTRQVAARYGTRIDADGSQTDYPESAWTLSSGATWTSPRTGGAYPAAWEIRIPADGVALRILPRLADQELVTYASTGNAYWEGAVSVSGDRSGFPLRGRGYVELTGFAPPRRG